MQTQQSTVIASYWIYKDKEGIPSEGNKIEYANRQYFEELTLRIKNVLADVDEPLEDGLRSLFDETFKLRIEAIKQIKHQQFDIEKLMQLFYERFESREVPSEYEFLHENVLFAARTLTKIAQALFASKAGNFSIPALDNIDLSILGNRPYETVKSSLLLFQQQFPNKELSKIIDLIDASLFTEISIIMADILYDHHNELNLPAQRVEIFSELIAEKAQEYGAAIFDIELTEKPDHTESHNVADDEDQYLAELGMKSYLENLDK